MPGVDIRIQAPAGSSLLPAVNFSDSFQRPDSPPFLGPNWWSEAVVNNGVAGTDLDSCINLNGSHATFGSSGVSSFQNASMWLVPSQIYLPRLLTFVNGGGTLFAKFTLDGQTGGGVSLGPAVMMRPNDTPGYFLEMGGALNTARLFRGVGILAPAQTLLASNLFTWAIGDQVELRGVFSVSAITLTYFLNGVQQGTFIDNSGSRVVNPGYYGMGFSNIAASSTLSVINFSGGIM